MKISVVIPVYNEVGTIKSFDKDIDRLRHNKEILKKLADSIREGQ